MRHALQFVRTQWAGLLVGLLVVVAALAHVPLRVVALDYFDPPKRFVWSMAVVVIGAVAWRHRRASLPSRAVGLSLLACLSWVLVRSLLRPGPVVETGVGMSWLLPGALFGAGLCVDRERVAIPLAGALLLTCVFQALLMVSQFCGMDPFFGATTQTFGYRPERMVGTIGYQNQAAGVLAVSSAAFIVLVRRRTLRWTLMGLVTVVVAMTGSRGALLALVVAIAAAEVVPLVVAARDVRRMALILGTAGAIMLILLGVILACTPSTRSRIVDIFARPQQVLAVASRGNMTRIALDMWSERPLLGWGAGQYAFQYLDRLGAMLPAGKTHQVLINVEFAREAHNDYLQFLAEFGLIGFGTVCALFVFIMKALSQAGEDEKPYRNGCILVLIYMLVAATVSFPWQTSMTGPLAAFVLGLMLPRDTATPAPERTGMHTLPSMLTHGACGFLGLLLLAWYGMEVVGNIRLPTALQDGHASTLMHTVPKWMHRYHALIGAALAEEQRYEDARSELVRAYAGYREPLLLNNLGHVFAKLEDWESAVEVYTSWAATGIKHPSALENLATAYEQAGDLASAARTLHRKVLLWPENAYEAARRVIALYLMGGAPQEAKQFIEAFESDPRTTPLLAPAEYDNAAGAALLATGDKASARARFESALRKNPALASAKQNLSALP